MNGEQPELDRATGGIGTGFGLGCLTQLATMLLIYCFLRLSSFLLGGASGYVVLSSWGVIQWLVLIPLILNQRGQGKTRTVQGLIISGCLGLLLSSACGFTAWEMFHPR